MRQLQDRDQRYRDVPNRFRGQDCFACLQQSTQEVSCSSDHVRFDRLEFFFKKTLVVTESLSSRLVDFFRPETLTITNATPGACAD